jgi:malonate decarboxylase epsilon subunit
MNVRDPKCVYISNVRARAVRVAKDLADNITHGARWHEATSVALELACEPFLEASPEHVLTDLARDNLDRMQAWPVTPGDARTFAEAGALRQMPDTLPRVGLHRDGPQQ